MTTRAREIQRNLKQITNNRVRVRHWEKMWVDVGPLRLFRWVPKEDRQAQHLATPLESSPSIEMSQLSSLMLRRRSLRPLGKHHPGEASDDSLLDIARSPMLSRIKRLRQESASFSPSLSSSPSSPSSPSARIAKQPGQPADSPRHDPDNELESENGDDELSQQGESSDNEQSLPSSSPPSSPSLSSSSSSSSSPASVLSPASSSLSPDTHTPPNHPQETHQTKRQRR